MKKFENLGFTSKVTSNKLIIEIPIRNLVVAFKTSPNNYDESEVKRGKRQMFAEFVAKQILEECDSETGDTHITKAFDSVFDLLFEGYEDGREFIKFGDEDEED
jgi:hypothetical protein